MGELRRCGECMNETVLVNNCGVAHTLLCPDCNREMDFIEHVETEWVGIEDEHDDYKLVENDHD